MFWYLFIFIFIISIGEIGNWKGFCLKGIESLKILAIYSIWTKKLRLLPFIYGVELWYIVSSNSILWKWSWGWSGIHLHSFFKTNSCQKWCLKERKSYTNLSFLESTFPHFLYSFFDSLRNRSQCTNIALLFRPTKQFVSDILILISISILRISRRCFSLDVSLSIYAWKLFSNGCYSLQKYPFHFSRANIN